MDLGYLTGASEVSPQSSTMSKCNLQWINAELTLTSYLFAITLVIFTILTDEAGTYRIIVVVFIIIRLAKIQQNIRLATLKPR
jgi:hypothetical protein